MLYTPEHKEYMYSRYSELAPGKERFAIIQKEMKEKFNIVLDSADQLYRIISRIKLSSGTPIKGKDADKSVEKLSAFLKEKNISIKDLENLFYRQTIEETRTFEINDGNETIKLGVVSDTHLGAKTCALNELHNIYDRFEEHGIKNVLHAGDLCDGGGKVYPGQLGELKVFGFDDMVEYIKTNYPKRDGMKTHFILGNHDEDFLKTGGADIGKAIQEVRDDMNYLGWYDADIIVNGVKFGLHHGAGGNAYAYSYKIQKYIETLTGKLKPQVYLLGHYHTSFYMAVRNIHAMTPGCFQKPNNFSVRLKLPNIVGGYIIEIVKNEKNEIKQFTPTFIQYYF